MRYLSRQGPQGVMGPPALLRHFAWCVRAGRREGGVRGYQGVQKSPGRREGPGWAGRKGLRHSGFPRPPCRRTALSPPSASSSIFLLPLLPAPALSNSAASPSRRWVWGRGKESPWTNVGRGASCPDCRGGGGPGKSPEIRAGSG